MTPITIMASFTTAVAPEVRKNPRVVMNNPPPRVAKSFRYVTPQILGMCWIFRKINVSLM